jgi:prevent-host-death family protein
MLKLGVLTLPNGDNKLSGLLDEVAQGKQITITRRGKPVAKLISAEPSFDREKAKQAARRLLELSKGATLGGYPLKT